MSVYLLPILLSFLAAGISIYTDARWGKIKNFVTLPLTAFGLAWSIYVGGILLLLVNLVAIVVIFQLIGRAGKFGAGDFKLITGIAVNLNCWDIRLGILFVAFFFIMLAVSAIFVRFKAYGFNFKEAIEKIKVEAMMELGGIKDANTIVHGNKVKHIGAPVIFFALVVSLIASYYSGFLPRLF